MVSELRSNGADRTPLGIDAGIGATGMVAATATAAALFPPADVPARLMVVALAVGAYAGVVADTGASLLTALLGFLLFSGFLADRHGELSWDGMTSLWYLTMFVLALGVGLGWRWIRAVSQRWPGTETGSCGKL